MYKKASTGSQPFTNSLLEYTLIMGHTLSSLQKTTNLSCKKCVILSNLSLELSQHSTCVSITYISTRAPQSVATITYRLLYLICWRRSLALVKWQVCSSSWGRAGVTEMDIIILQHMLMCELQNALFTLHCPRKYVAGDWTTSIFHSQTNPPQQLSPRYLQRKALKHSDRVNNAILHMRKHSICV